MGRSLRIGAREIANGQRAFLIAEVAQSHDGSLGLAHSYIDAAANVGADAVKFQTHIAAAESTLDEPFRVRFSRQDATRYDYWRRMEFTAEQWAGLVEHARDRGIVFLSSAFSVAAVELLDRLGMPAWKVGSGEFRSTELIERMVASGKPVLYSTGMSNWSEIDTAAAQLEVRGADYALFQCTSRYPTPLELVGLNILGAMQTRYDCPVGLSDHSGSPWPSVTAIARGAAMIEAHITFDRAMFGPDVPASLTTAEWKLLAEARDAIAELDAHPVDKDAEAHALSPMRDLFTKSVAPVRSLPAGTLLTADLLTTKKPGTGIPAAKLGDLVGRRLARDVAADRVLTEEDIDDQA